jgi:tetratricopeptide (TPR) repeat protein
VSLRAVLTLAGLAILSYLAAFRGGASASVDDAEAALRAGRYAEAIEAFEKESVANPTASLFRGWAEALRMTGAYDEALSVI